MADYSAMNSYLQNNNLHYFTFSPNSEKPNMPMAAVFVDIEKAFDTTWHLSISYLNYNS
jgi:hypothetical protein